MTKYVRLFEIVSFSPCRMNTISVEFSMVVSYQVCVKAQGGSELFMQQLFGDNLSCSANRKFTEDEE